MALDSSRSVEELIQVLGSPSDSDAAAEALIERGSSVVPVLVETVVDDHGDPVVREHAAVTLGQIVPEGVASLLRLLTSESDDVADMAAWAVRWPPASWQAERCFLDMLVSSDTNIRLRGARGLKYIGVDLTELHPILTEAAEKDPDPFVRQEAQLAVERGAPDQ